MSEKRIPIGANPRVLAAFGWLFVVLAIIVMHYSLRSALLVFLEHQEVRAGFIGAPHPHEFSGVVFDYQIWADSDFYQPPDLGRTWILISDSPGGGNNFYSLSLPEEVADQYPIGKKLSAYIPVDNDGLYIAELFDIYFKAAQIRLLLNVSLLIFCAGMAFWAFRRADRAALAEKLK